MKRLVGLLAAATLWACDAVSPGTDTRVAQPEPLLSGRSFLTPETQALQDDNFANPGYLWIDRGAALFEQAVAGAPACGTCHGDRGAELAGMAARYPEWDEAAGMIVNLEGRINACRVEHQSAGPLAYESDELLALTAFVASLSRGLPLGITHTPQADDALALGADYFQSRRGQFNLSCANCHQDNWGQSLRGDTISQGHGNGFPAYRLEWESLGSLHRRFQDCDAGVRAASPGLGSDTYLALEYYLALRAKGLEIETPAVRR